jgi:hypothetical protein
LESIVVDDGVTLDVGFVDRFVGSFDRWSVEVDFVVDDQQRVVGVEDVVVDTDTV